MSTATAERFVAQPATAVRFKSARKELILVRTPVQNTYGPGGQKSGETLPDRIPFVEAGDGTKRGVLTTEDPELIGWLTTHKRFGDPADGFWIDEDPAPEPTQDELRTLLDAATRADEAKLREIIEQESAGYRRAVIIEPAQEALRALDAMRQQAAVAAQQAEQAQAAAIAAARAEGEQAAIKAAKAEQQKAKPEPKG